MNKVMSTVSGMMMGLGFLLTVGIAGRSDYATEVGEYLPWYDGWQFLLIGLLLMGLSCIIGNLIHVEK